MNKLLQLVGAFYDETRIAIVAFLMQKGECCVCELSTSLNLSQSRLSRHLGILYDADVLSMKRNGRWVYYAISDSLCDSTKAILKDIEELYLQLPAKIEACNIEKGEEK